MAARVSPSMLGEGAQRQIAATLYADGVRSEMRRNKFNAQACEMDGVRFGSKAERDRYAELLVEQRAGLISNLEPHPVYRLVVNGTDIGRYTADSRYFRDGKRVVEEVKSAATKRRADYVLRRKLVEALFPGTVITEVIR